MLMRAFCWLWVAGALMAGGELRAATRAAPPAVLITSALTVESDAPAFPQASPGRTVSLPDDWWRSRPGTSGPIWYRVVFTVDADTARAPLAAWIERACGSVEVQLNGAAMQGSAAAPAALCQQGLWLPLPAAGLVVGQNQLDIRLAGRPLEQVGSARRAAGLSPVVVGPSAALEGHRDGQARLHAGAWQSASVGLAVIGAFVALSWWRNRREAFLGFYALLCIAVAAAGLPLWQPQWLLDPVADEVLFASAWPLATLGAVQFLLRHAGRQERLADVVLVLQCVLMPLSLALLGPDHLSLGVQAWAAVLLVELATAAAVHLRAQWGSSRRAFWIMSALLLVVLVSAVVEQASLRAGAHDLASAGGLVLPLVLSLLGLRLAQQRGRALESAEASRALLEQRVAEVKTEIEANYRQLAELRVVQVTDRERKRIAADLHDDLGAKLLTIVHTSESERISTLAREALEEMRLSVRGLTGKPVRLEDALGDWRAEVISRLGQAGIEAVWNMPTDELPQTLPARAFVQTTRIIREAVNNIIKHSGASQCAVRSQIADGDFQLVIQDNGKGISVEVDGRLDRGHGLSTMKGRAKQLHGQCLVESGPGYGTVIRLTIPLEPAGQAA
jgi:two-component system sensor histidine kinase UhpB